MINGEYNVKQLYLQLSKTLKKNNGKQTKYLQTNKLKQESNFKPTKPELSNRKT